MLKLKEGFILREVAGETVVIPSGEDINLNMMITLNGTAAFLWQKLEQGCTEEELVAALLAEYDVEADKAAEHAAKFVAKLNEHGFLA